MSISNKAVEAAAKASHASRWPNAPWDALNDDARIYARTNVRLALEAAAPHMLAAAWQAGKESGFRDAYTDEEEEEANPYRTQP